MGQLSNDVIPSAIHTSVAEELNNRLVPPLEKLHEALEAFLAPAIDSPKYPDQQLDQEATRILAGLITECLSEPGSGDLHDFDKFGTKILSADAQQRGCAGKAKRACDTRRCC